MPLIFPSHQGLILPLWLRFPPTIDAVALSVGAAMPDLLDAAAWPFRGELGQWLGHSLLGVVLSVPPGLALARLVRRLGPERVLARLDEDSPPPAGLSREVRSIGIGALSHVAFDLISHGSFLLLWPFYRRDDVFPSWWCHRWGSIPLPVYREPYPLAPHTIAWLLLTVIGALIFFSCLRPRPSLPSRPP